MANMRNSNSELIRVDSISKYFGQLHVFDSISFRVNSGEFLSVVGPSGCGKTTLLKIIGGILNPSSGRVLIRNSDASLVRHKGEFGFVFQNPVLLPWRTLYKNVCLPLELLGIEDSGEIPSILKLVSLNGFEDALPKQLSGGMKQRAAIARALTFKPSVLLMDEPFGAVDELTRERLNYELMAIWINLETTVLLVTHSIPEAVLMSDRILVLSNLPAKVEKIVTVDLPRPRDKQVRSSAAYEKIIEEVRSCLKE